MLTYRFILSTIFQICLFLSGTVAFTQETSGQWVGDLYLMHTFSNSFGKSSILIDENNKIHKIFPGLGTEKDFFSPRKAISSYAYFYGTLYVTAEDGKNKYRSGSRWTFAKWQDDKWHFLGDYKMESPAALLKAIPCDNDRFIAIFHANKGMDSKSISKMTPFHLMSIPYGKTEFTIDEAIDHAQDMLRMEDREHFALAWMTDTIMTDTHAILINKATSLYWVFSLRSATLVKAGSIFKEETAKMIIERDPTNYTNGPILCANPEKNGTVLIAAQKEALVAAETRNLMKEYNILINTNPYRRMSIEDVHEKLFYPMFKEFVNRSPYIVWYRLYPETGEVEKLKEPPRGGSNFRDEGKNDIWRPMPDGSVANPIYLHAEVEKQLANRSATLSPDVFREMAKNLLRDVAKKQARKIISDLSASTRKADFSISDLKAEVKKQVIAEIENQQLKPDVEKRLKAEVEKLLKAVSKQAMTEIERQIKNRIAEEQRDKQ